MCYTLVVSFMVTGVQWHLRSGRRVEGVQRQHVGDLLNTSFQPRSQLGVHVHLLGAEARVTCAPV